MEWDLGSNPAYFNFRIRIMTDLAAVLRLAPHAPRPQVRRLTLLAFCKGVRVGVGSLTPARFALGDA